MVRAKGGAGAVVKGRERLRGPVYRPLAGLRVIDLSDISGAYCTKLLADMGADVVKVEPLEGESTRRIGPFAKDIPDIERSLTFAHYNANKRSVTLNLDSGDGKALLRRLVRGADVLVESFPPGYMDSLGLGYKSLRRLNRGLIMTSITPFGQDGPYRDYPGTELTLLAAGGVTYLCGEQETPPCTAPGYMAYDAAGTYAATGIMMAHYHRLFTGEGQHQDISVQEAVAAIADWIGPRYQVDDVYLRRRGPVEEVYLPSGLYKCKDGYIMIFPLTPEQWTAFVNWMGNHPELLEPFWLNLLNRAPNDDVLKPIFAEFIAGFNKQEFSEEAQAKGIPATPLNTMLDFIDDKHEKMRGYFYKISHKSLGSHIVSRGPYLVQDWVVPAPKPAPLLGQHDKEVYGKEMGLSREELMALKGSGAI